MPYDDISETVIETVVGKMKTLNDKGITVWLRYDDQFFDCNGMKC